MFCSLLLLASKTLCAASLILVLLGSPSSSSSPSCSPLALESDMTNFGAVVGVFSLFFAGLFGLCLCLWSLSRVSVSGLCSLVACHTLVSSSIGRRFTYGYCNFHMAPAMATGCPIGGLGTGNGRNNWLGNCPRWQPFCCSNYDLMLL